MELIGEQRKPRFSQVARALLLRCLPPGQKKQREEYMEAHLELCPHSLPQRYSYHLFFPGSFRKLWPILHTGVVKADERKQEPPCTWGWPLLISTWAFFCNWEDVYPIQANSSSLESRYWVCRKVMLMEYLRVQDLEPQTLERSWVQWLLQELF